MTKLPYISMTAKALKYHSELEGNTCSLNEFKEHDKRIAYRWVFEDALDARNFLPIYMLNKERLQHDQANGNFSCTCWAISFYKTENQAKEKFEKLMAKSPKIYKKLGTHIAKGYLTSTDGVSDECNDIGHFNHFEYEAIHLASKFSIKSCLVSS